MLAPPPWDWAGSLVEFDCDSVLPSVMAFVPSEEVSSLVVDLDHQGSGEKEREGREEGGGDSCLHL